MTKKQKELQVKDVTLDENQMNIQEEFDKLIESDFDIEKAVSSLVKTYKFQINERKKLRSKERGKHGKRNKQEMEGSN